MHNQRLPPSISRHQIPPIDPATVWHFKDEIPLGEALEATLRIREEKIDYRDIVIAMDDVTRKEARMLAEEAEWITHKCRMLYNTKFVFDWWHATPADAGSGLFLIGIRCLGLFELAQ